MSDLQNKIPSFDKVMGKDTQNGKIPSFEDIMGNDEPVKKKGIAASVGLSISKRGVQPATLDTLSDPLSQKEKLTNYLQGLKEPQKQTIEGGIGIVNPKKPYNEEKVDKEARNNINEVMYGEGDDWKDPLQSTFKKALSKNPIPTAKDLLIQNRSAKLVEENLYPDGFEAVRILNDGHFINDGDKNWTAKKVKDKADNYVRATQPFRDLQFMQGDKPAENPTDDYRAKEMFYDAAMKAYAEKNPNFKAQMEVAGVPNIESNAKRGQIIQEMMNDENFIAYATKENPNLIPLVQQVQQDLYADNKDFAVNQIANKVSRELQKSGYNDIDRIVNYAGENAKEAADLTAQSTLTPEEYKIYQENNVFEKLDMPSMAEGFASAGKDFFGGMKNTFQEPFRSTSESIQRSWGKEASRVSAEPEGLTKFLRDSGHAMGFVASIGAAANVGGSGVLMSPQAAGAVSTAVGFFGDQLEQGRMKYPGSPVKAVTSALVNTSLYSALSFQLFPAAKVEQAFAKVQPEAAKVVENLANGTITRGAARQKLNTVGKQALDFLTTGLQKNTKVSAEMTGIAILNKGLDKLMGMDDKTFAEYHPEGEEADTFKSMFLSNIFVNGLAARGELRSKNNIAKVSIWEAANNPQRYRRIIEAAEIRGEIPNAKELLDNLDYIVSTKKELDSRGLTEKQQKDYLLNSLQGKVLAQSKPASPDAVLTRQHTDRIKNLEEINQGILEGKDAEEIVTTEQQDLADQQAKADADKNKVVEKGQTAVEKLLEEKDKDDKNVLKGVYRDIAKSDPIGFLQEIADQAFGMERKDGERVKSETAVPDIEQQLVKQYGADVVNAAKELFPIESKPEAPVIDPNRELDMGSEEITKPVELSTKIPGDEGYVPPADQPAPPVKESGGEVIPVVEKEIVGNDVTATNSVDLIKEAVRNGAKKVEVIFNEPYNEAEHGNLPEKLKATLRGNKKEVFDVVEEGSDILSLAKSKDVKSIRYVSEQTPSLIGGENTVTKPVSEGEVTDENILSKSDKELMDRLNYLMKELNERKDVGRKEGVPVVKEKEAKSITEYLSKKYGIESALEDMGMFSEYGVFDRSKIGIKINRETTLDDAGRLSASLSPTGNISRRTIFHEYLHPFADILAKHNRELYDEIYNKAVELNKKEKFADVEHYPEGQRKEEMVVRVLDRLSDGDLPPSLVQRFLNWLSELFYSKRKNNSATLQKLSKDTTPEQLYNIFKNYGNLKDEVAPIIMEGKLKRDLNFLTKVLKQEGLSEETKASVVNSIKELEKELARYSINPEQANKEIERIKKELIKRGVDVSKFEPNGNIKKVPESTKQERSDAEHAKYIKSKFLEEFTKKGVPKEQVLAATALMDARAKASGLGDAWYRQIEDIGNGEFKGRDLKYQGEWKKILLAAAVSLQPLKTDFKGFSTKGKEKIEVVKSNPKEKAQIEKFVKDYFAENKEEAPKEVIDRAIEVWEKFGKPVIMPDSTSKDERAFANHNEYNGKLLIDTISNITNFNDFIAEMAHAAQYQSGQSLSFGQYKSQKERDKYEYERKGSVEYDAHKLIEPLLANFVLFGKRGDDLTIATMNSMAPSLKDQIIPAAEKFKIKFQNTKGAVETLANGRKIIHALDAPDFSTAVHELAHIFEDELADTDRKIVQDWAGTKEWNRETSETFARGFERYLRDGNAPTPELKTLFQKFKEWLTNIYQSLKGSPIEKRVSPEVKKVFDRLLTEQKTKPVSEVEVKSATTNEANQATPESNEPVLPKEGSGAKENANQEGKGTVPPKATSGEEVNEGGGSIAGITQAANEVRRKDTGLPEFQREPQSFEQWTNEAEKLLKDGYDVEKLMDRLASGEDATPVENAIRKIYYATVDAEVAKNPTDKLLALQKRNAQIGDQVNARAGRNLVSLKGEGSPLESISDFYVAKMEAAGVDKLTEQQKKETKEAFDNVQKADANATAAMEAYREEIAKLKAENELLKQKKTTPSKAASKTKEDFVAERKEIVKSIADKWKNAGKDTLSSDIPYRKQLAAIAPDVIKLVKSYAVDASIRLEEIVSKVYDELKDFVKDKKDIQDIIAGEYNEKRPTRNDLAAKMRDLRDEAYYINKLERLLKGEEPKSEKKKVERNRQIKELQQKIKEFYKAEKDANKPPKEVKDADLSKLEAIKKRNETETAKIKERISKGDFEAKKPLPFLEDPEMQKKFPKEYKAALDAIVAREEARHEFDIALMKDQMAKRNIGKKGIDLVGDIIGTTKALVTGIDASGIGIQNLVAMIAHPRSAAKALPASFGDFTSAARMDRWLASVHSSKLFPLAQKSGLDITEPKSLKASEREELFTHNLLDRQIKYKGKTYVISKYVTKPFERIFTGLGNRMRWNLWERGVEKLQEEGYTWQSHPEEYKSLAKVLNTETGRGTLHKQVENAYGLVSAGIWSPRLMASRLNILGLGDLGNLIAGGKKGYYGGLTPRMREYAIKDFAKFVVFGALMVGAAGLSFADDTDLDPNSSTFGTFEVEGKRYNIWGGFTQYVRLATKLALGGERKSDGTYQQADRLKTSLRFLWSKTTPAVGTAISLMNKGQRDYMGQPVTASGAAESLLIPLSIRGIAEGIKREGAGSILWTGLPSFVGMNVSYQSDFEKQGSGKPFMIKDPEKGTKREATPDEIKNYNEQSEKEYKNEMERLKTQWIVLDRYGGVSVTRDKDGEFVEDDEGKRVKFSDLTEEQKKQLDTKIKRQMKAKVKKELFGEGQDDD